MNYDVSKNTLSVRNLIFEGCKEVPVDLDFSLPDYCPDIQKILKCKVTPNITSRNISADRLNIEGISKIKVIYLDSQDGKIRCCENSIPFSCSIDIRSNPENAFATTKLKVEYLNCRAVSPRKLDIHGSFSVSAKVYGKENLDISSNVSGKDIQQKISDMRISNLVGIGQQQFSISETIEFPEDKKPPEFVVNSDVRVIINDYKNMSNKVVAKGEIIVKIFYIDDMDSGNMETLEYKIPMSQIVDVPSVSENSRCVIDATVLSHSEEISPQNEGKNGFISCEIKIVLSVMAYEDKDISIVSDVYSTDYDAEISQEPIEIEQLIDTFKENINHKDTIKFSDGSISEIIDGWVDETSVSCKVEDNKLVLSLKASVCVLALDGENTPIYVERILEFEHLKAYESNLLCVKCECDLIPVNADFRVLSQESIEVNLNFEVSGQVYSCRKYAMITAVSADETKTFEKDGAALTVYYAAEGENIWDIAKKYHTGLKMIKEENALSEDKLRSNGMLLIPMK